MTVSAAALGLLTLFGGITPWGLLFFTFVLGLGAALNGPPWQAILPELVPRRELPSAITLQSIGFNIARAAGPAIGGLLVAAAGPAWTFLLNAVSFLGVVAVLVAWRRPSVESVLPAERFLGAMRTGLRYVRHAPEVIAPIVRGSTFVLCASSLWALLPIVARIDLKRGAAGYGILLTALGVGAVAAALVLPRLKRNNSTDLVVAAATLVFAAATVVLALVHNFPLVCFALLLAGGAWLSHLSSLNVAVQTVVPPWVQGRALSVYMLIFYAGLAGGSALWGWAADHLGVAGSLLISVAGMVVGLLATMRFHLQSGEGLNLAPSRQWPALIVHHEPEPERGPVLITVDYEIDPARSAEFARAMDEVRRIRLRDGALQWGLFSDSAVSGRHTEVFLVKSWLEYLRHRGRSTISDRENVEKARGFHIGPEPPAVRRLIAEPVPRD